MAWVRRNERPGSDIVQAVAGIYEEYGGFIRAVIHFRARNESEEEDLFQGFFIALIRRPIPADVRNFKSYLYQAVINYIRDSIRQRVKYRCAVEKYAQEAGIGINSRPSENVILAETEAKNAIVASFARHLQQRHAEAFVLRYRDNRSISEIAATMGVDGRTVSRYLSECIRRLRNTLAT